MAVTDQSLEDHRAIHRKVGVFVTRPADDSAARPIGSCWKGADRRREPTPCLIGENAAARQARVTVTWVNSSSIASISKVGDSGRMLSIDPYP